MTRTWKRGRLEIWKSRSKAIGIALELEPVTYVLGWRLVIFAGYRRLTVRL